MKFKRMFEKINILIVNKPNMNLKTLLLLLKIIEDCLSNKEFVKYRKAISELNELKNIQLTIDKTMSNVDIFNLENELELLKNSIN